MIQTLPTEFAPAERLSTDEVAAQSQSVLSIELLTRAFETVNDLVMVLNAQRQIVYANRSVLDLLGAKDLEAVLGLRPGEAIGCMRACQGPGGCGTTKFCSTCGAVNAILTAQAGKADQRECRITRQDSDALDLLVRTTPTRVDGLLYTVCCIRDISHEKRLHALERVFFHDVLNTACGLLMLSHRVAGDKHTPADRKRLHNLLERMAEEIMAHRDLMAAESSELAVTPTLFSVREMLEDVMRLYSDAPVCQGRRLFLEPCEDITITSDMRLLSRVLGNLIKNALEAAPKDSGVTVSITPEDGGVTFGVHNEGVMLQEVLLQIFQRSFSTKGAGRGLGTYSIKLLTDRYLGGKVWVASNADNGTIFRAWYPLVLKR